MRRRDFLLMRTDGGERPAALSCERLYMRFVDAQAGSGPEDPFEWLTRDLEEVTVVRLTETSWLSCEELRQRLDLVLDQFQARGGRVLRDN